MTQRDPAVSLSQMRDAAKRAIAIVSTRDRQDLVDDNLLDLALVRLLEILGEAANRVPRDDQIRLAAIPWSEIIGLRNRLIHGYDQIDLDVVWQIVTTDLPVLVRTLEGLLSGTSPSGIGGS